LNAVSLSEFNSTMLAPIVLFVYDRPLHLSRLIDSLKKNKLAKGSELIIYSDGPKNKHAFARVNRVRELIAEINGFKKVSIVNREINLGLSSSIISGVTEILEQYQRIIVLEDDLVVSPFFLEFMNSGLDKYSMHEEVACIHGYVYPCKGPLPNTFFLKGADCWGWGTWRDSWKIFNPDGLYLLNELKKQNLTSAFDFGGAYPFTQMLSDQIEGKNDSWAIRWYASAYLMNKFTLYPGLSLVDNFGSDGSGTHQVQSKKFKVKIALDPVTVDNLPISESRIAKKAFIEYFLKHHQSKFSRFIYHMKHFFGIIV
jgi:hypothetical protein